MCKPYSGVGPVVPEPLLQVHCTLSCIFLFFFVVFIERKSEEYSMHGFFLLGSHIAIQLVENVENMLDCGECFNAKHAV